MGLLDDQSLQIVISAKDEATKVINGVGATIKNMSPIFKGMAVAGTAAFAAISTSIGYSLKQADESAKVMAQLGAVLKSTGESAGLSAQDITEQATALQKMTTYSDEAVLGGANLLLTFKNIKGGVFQEALPALLDMSTAMGTDLKSSAIQVGKALNDPIEGISALSRVGVTFSESQKEVIANLVKTGKTAEAQKMILAELNSEFGGSAAAAAQTFGGQVEQLNNSLSDIAENIGTALVPVINDLVTKIKPVVDQVVDWIAKNPELTKNILIGVAAFTALIAVVGTLGLVLPPLIAGFGLLLGPVGLIILAIGALIAVGYQLYKHWDDIKLGAQIVWEAIKTSISNAIDSVATYVSTTLDSIATFFTTVWDGIVNALRVSLAFIVGAVQLFLDWMFPTWEANLILIWTKWIEIWTAIKDYVTIAAAFISTEVSKFMGVLGAIFSAGADFLKKNWILAWTAIKDFMIGIWAPIQDSVKAAIDFITTQIQKAIDLYNKLKSMISEPIKAAKSGIGSTVSSFVSNALKRGTNTLGFEHGGTVPGAVGTPVPIIAHGQEKIIPAGNSRSSDSGVYNFNVVINNPVVPNQSAANQLRKDMDAAVRDLIRVHKLQTI